MVCWGGLLAWVLVLVTWCFSCLVILFCGLYGIVSSVWLLSISGSGLGVSCLTGCCWVCGSGLDWLVYGFGG